MVVRSLPLLPLLVSVATIAVASQAASELVSGHVRVASVNAVAAAVAAAAAATPSKSINQSGVEKETSLPEQFHWIGEEGPWRRARWKRRAASTALPQFAGPIGNISAVLGRDVRLVCTVDNLGQFQVAWLKEETRTILSIDTNIIITNYRIFLIPDEEERKWVLHIKDVQESDRGFYQCQVNTNPMRSTSGYLEVVVPPTILEAQSTQVAEVVEHANVSIQCKANGHPKPAISWRREDGAPIRLAGPRQPTNWAAISTAAFTLNESNSKSSGVAIRPTPMAHAKNPSSAQTGGGLRAPPPPTTTTTTINSQLNDVKSDKLALINVDRSMAGLYVCTATNGIPGQASKRIPLYVKFAPKVSLANKYISASLGQQLDIDCLVEAFPKADSYWSKRPHQRTAHAAPLTWASQQQQLQSDKQNRRAPSHRRLQSKGSANLRDWRDMISAPNQQEEQPDAGGADQAPLDQSRRTSELSMQALAHYNERHARPRFRRRRRRRQASSDPQQDDVTHTGSAIEWRPNGTAPIATATAAALVSVRQTPIGMHTSSLRLTIASMKWDDFGEYTCISSNSMGSSQAQVIVTRADSGADSESEYQRDIDEGVAVHELARSGASQASDLRGVNLAGGGSPSPPAPQSIIRNNLPTAASSSQHRVVYDENYLQAIKNRQHIASGKLQQKLRMKSRMARVKQTASR